MAEDEKKETREEREAREWSERCARLNRLRGQLDGQDIIGYVYRLRKIGGNFALPKINEFWDDDDKAGLTYGPGSYQVTYFKVDPHSGILIEPAFATCRYHVGPEYEEIYREACASDGRKCYLANPSQAQAGSGGFMDFLSTLDAERLKSWLAFGTILKEAIGGGSGGGRDRAFEMVAEQNKLLIGALSGNNSKRDQQPQQNQLVETVMAKAVDRMFQPQESPLKQLREAREVMTEFQELTTAKDPEKEERANMSPIERMIEKAVNGLPAILEAYKGNVEAAAAEVKAKNEKQAWLIKNSPSMQKQFYAAMVEKSGKDVADRWAAAYGIDPARFRAAPAQPAQQAKQAPQQQQQAPRSSKISF